MPLRPFLLLGKVDLEDWSKFCSLGGFLFPAVFHLSGAEVPQQSVLAGTNKTCRATCEPDLTFLPSCRTAPWEFRMRTQLGGRGGGRQSVPRGAQCDKYHFPLMRACRWARPTELWACWVKPPQLQDGQLKSHAQLGPSVNPSVKPSVISKRSMTTCPRELGFAARS